MKDNFERDFEYLKYGEFDFFDLNEEYDSEKFDFNGEEFVFDESEDFLGD